ncbi:MAG: sulfatase [bacterium]|nr:sulfatase [bacterium]
MNARPNIIYFVAHDVGRHLGCYHIPVTTPCLDAFAAEAVRFENAFCNATACTPSRICAMTGLYAHSSGGVGLAHMGWPLANNVPTIVDYFNTAGYETIHSGMEHERHPGLNRYQVDLQKHWVHFDVRRAVDDALAYLARRDRTRPFYLNIGSQEPHASTWHKAEAVHGGIVPPEDVYVPPYVPDTLAIRHQLGRFQAALRYMDTQFGRLLEGLRALGHDHDSIIVFTTDHGIAGPRSKGTLYDRGVEIALMIRLPDAARAGSVCDHLIQNIDLVPSLLEAAGIPVPAGLHGRSFWPVLSGGKYIAHEAIFIERNFHGEPRMHGVRDEYEDRYDPVRAIRTTEFHYIKYFAPDVKCRPWLPWEVAGHAVPLGTPLEFCVPPPREPRAEVELYHVRHDPQEFINVAGRPEFRAVEAALAQRLQEWLVTTNDFVLRGEVPKRYEAPGWGPWEGMPADEEEARAAGWFS